MGATRSAVQKWMEQGYVTRQGKPLSKSTKLCVGEEINICIPPLTKVEIEPENIPLDIRYEDSDILVVNKPKDMVVHPAPGLYPAPWSTHCYTIAGIRCLGLTA